MHNFIMRLQESAEAALNKLKNIIFQKEQQPMVTSRATYDWKAAELTLCSQLADLPTIQTAIILQKQALKQRISCFYTYFLLQKVSKTQNGLNQLQQETSAITEKQSKYHSIKAFTKMREHLLSKINKFTGSQIKGLFQDIDDIRFLNFEIINGIQQWKEQWRTAGEAQPVFYDANINYLLKINNDNADMINLANFKKTKFISPPNPFFLSEDGNLQGMSAKQKQDINDCMEVINKERTIDLRMAVSGGIFLLKPQKTVKGGSKDKQVQIVKRQMVENSFVSNAKNEIISGKQQQIRKIYKINRSLQNTKLKANQERISNINTIKNSNQVKQSEKLKMYSSVKRLRSNSQKNLKKTVNEGSLLQTKLNTKFAVFQSKQDVSKVSRVTSNGIRSEISRFVKQLDTDSPNKKRMVKETKPKIKLIQQKSTVVVEDQLKAVFNMTASNLRPGSKKNSTFYKKIQPIAEQIHTKQYERSKKMKQIQSKILKEKIHSEQDKFIAHRQLQLKLKQQQLKKQLKKNLKQLQLQTLRKRKQYQKQILQQEKRMKETEKLIIKEKNKYKQIQNELQQKKLKQKLLRKIMQEKQEIATKHYQTQIQVQKALQLERKLRQKMEQQSLQLIQNQKKKMEVLYEQMVLKNKLIYEQNQLKMAQINEIDQRRAQESQKTKKIEEQFNNSLKRQKDTQNDEALKQHQPQDIESLKIKLKKELLQQIRAKKQRQEELQRQQEAMRQQRLKKIEQEVARTLKEQQQNLERENAQFLKKIEYFRQISLIPSTHQQLTLQAQKAEQPQNQQKLQQQQQQQKNQPSQVQQNEHNPVTFELGPNQTDNNVQQQMKKLQQKTQLYKQKHPEVKDDKEEVKDLDAIQKLKVEILPISPINHQQNNQHSSPIIQKQKKQQLKPQQDEKQQQQLRQKYKNLSKHIKKVKQINIQQKQVSSFLDNFLSSLQKPVRQMLPWNKFDLQRILNTKNADIFEQNSLGWLQDGKYILIGNLECVEIIYKKYGSIQIHQILIFDKINPYQKQFLTKKMKIFQEIGFVFQKKLADANKYSIRFVIKLPKQTSKQPNKAVPSVPSPPVEQHRAKENDDMNE